MRILMISAELAPLAKTGGLGDAVAGLADALAGRGHDVRVLLPGYGRALPEAYGRTGQLSAGGFDYVTARHDDGGPHLYLLDAPALRGDIYAGDHRDGERFWLFNRAAVELARGLDWKPDVVHCHDWHAALVPALARREDAPEALASARSVLTLHNIGYQGAFGLDLLPEDARAAIAAVDEPDGRDYTVFLRIGIRHADAVTTVSPTYAEEIRTPAFGMGLDDLLRERGDDLVGILNGADYSVWSPETDPFLDAHFSRDALDGKRRVKRALCETLGLADEAPLVGAVTRLVEQKGIDLLAGALPALLEHTNARFALLGSGEAGLEHTLESLAAANPERFAFRRGYDEPLAHRIIAGSDLLLVPSRYEPCGLTQLYAMRYGTIPVVRATGGLADTVVHFDPAEGTGTGSVFRNADPRDLIGGMSAALAWFADPALRARVVDNAMRADYAWPRQCEHYEALYGRLLRKPPRRAVERAAGP